MPHTIKNRWKKVKQKKRVGFFARMASKNGRNILKRRRDRGRQRLSA